MSKASAYRKATVGAIVIALLCVIVWILVFGMGFFSPALGVLVPIVLKKGYEYISDGGSAFERRGLIIALSFVVALVATVGGYWVQGIVMYDVPFLAVPVILWQAFTVETAYGITFLAYLGIGLLATLVGVLICLRKAPEK